MNNNNNNQKQEAQMRNFIMKWTKTFPQNIYFVNGLDRTKIPNVRHKCETGIGYSWTFELPNWQCQASWIIGKGSRIPNKAWCAKGSYVLLCLVIWHDFKLKFNKIPKYYLKGFYNFGIVSIVITAFFHQSQEMKNTPFFLNYNYNSLVE